LEKDKFYRIFRRGIIDKTPVCNDLVMSRRIEGQLEFGDEEQQIYRTLVVVDTTIDPVDRKALWDVTYETIFKKRDAFNVFTFLSWDGSSLSERKTVRIRGLKLQNDNLSYSDNPASSFFTLFKELNHYGYIRNSDLCILLVQPETLETIENRRYMGSSKTFLFTCSEKEYKKTILKNPYFSLVMSLSKPV